MSDELKPVRCGCGGEAEVTIDGNGEMTGVAIKCKNCGITTAYYLDDMQKAITAWNRAMGADKRIFIPDGYVREKIGGKNHE